MKGTLLISWIIAGALFGASASGQAPSLSHAVPAGVAPGQAADVTFFGGNLSGATGLWSSFPAGASLAPGIEKNGSEAGKVTYRVDVPACVPVGLGGVRVATSQGLSNLRLFMIDDLPAVAEDGRNKTIDSAQRLVLPVAVDGGCEAESRDFYKFTARAGQRVSVEAVARRLGSPLDPVIRLLDSDSRELMYSDDEGGLSGDCRYAYKFYSDGEYVIEIRDACYQGGGDYRYRLRLGDFPLPTTAFPLGGQKGTTCEIAFAGPAVEGVPAQRVTLPAAVAGDWMSIGVKYPKGQGSAMAGLVVSGLREEMESEPNDSPEAGSRVNLPCAINGRFAAPKDRDYYSFEAQRGLRVLIAGKARSLGSPSDLFLRLYRPGGAPVAETEDSDTQEGAIDYTIPEDGTYRLMIEELYRRGGPEHAYRVEIEPYRQGFLLAVDADKFDAPRGGIFVAKVTCVRRDYNGPIVLSVEGAGEGLVLANHTILEGKNETLLSATLPSGLETGRAFAIGILGRAKIGEGEFTAKASTLGALRKVLHGLPYPPAALDGAIGLGIGPVFPSFFELSVASQIVLLPQPNGKTTFKIMVKRLNAFEEQITVALDLLPAGVMAEFKPIEKGKSETDVTLSGSAALEEGDYAFRITGRGTFQNQPQQVILENVVLRIGNGNDHAQKRT
ncbi:MAG: PPC domain-containing protein [Planctomycetes bacterium]|nr:PPC domain-containing protein [Planctomycetota bacterium]